MSSRPCTCSRASCGSYQSHAHNINKSRHTIAAFSSRLPVAPSCCASNPLATSDVGQSNLDFDYDWNKYRQSKQSVERAAWAEALRSATSRRKHQFWEPQLDPPPLLANVVVVLVSPKNPVTVGHVARAMSCFECDTIRIVQPRCGYITRNSRNASKGAQYLLYRHQSCPTLADALKDCSLSVAFTRWVQGRTNAHRDLRSLIHDPHVRAVLEGATVAGTHREDGGGEAPARELEHWEQCQHLETQVGPVAVGSSAPYTPGPLKTADREGSTEGLQEGPGRERPRQGSLNKVEHDGAAVTPKGMYEEPSVSNLRTTHQPSGPSLALVFGREELGLSDKEVDLCDLTCSIPIGRLQESLSVSHAVSITLAHLFQEVLDLTRDPLRV